MKKRVHTARKPAERGIQLLCRTLPGRPCCLLRMVKSEKAANLGVLDACLDMMDEAWSGIFVKRSMSPFSYGTVKANFRPLPSKCREIQSIGAFAWADILKQNRHNKSEQESQHPHYSKESSPQHHLQLAYAASSEALHPYLRFFGDLYIFYRLSRSPLHLTDEVEPINLAGLGSSIRCCG